MIWELRTQQDAIQVLDYFNGFHDGFIHKLMLRSHDVFTKEGPEVTDIAHQVTGRFDVRIDIAHYNYGQGTQPHDRIVRCFFKEVGDFHLDLRPRKSYEWPVINVEILQGERQRETKGTETCFALSFVWSRLVNNSWETYHEQLLTFKAAEFEERSRA